MPDRLRQELRRAVEFATTVAGRLRLEVSGAGHALSAADHGVGLLYGQGIAGPVAGSNFYGLREILTMNKGKHAWKMGGDFSLEKFIHDKTLNNYGVFSFDGTITGDALADFMMGLVKTMNQDAPVTKIDNTWYSGLFVQDDWRIHPRFTLNLTREVCEAVMESTAQYWKPVWQPLEGRYWLHLAQAHSNRAPRGRKRDFEVAERLLRRHVAGELILSFVPDPEQRPGAEACAAISENVPRNADAPRTSRE